MAAGDWVTLARLERARGIRGEITADSFGAGPERFEQLSSPHLFAADGSSRVVEVEAAWEHNGRMVLKFRGIDTRTEAEELQGGELRVPLAERPPAPEGEFYFSDLVGCEVVEKSGRLLGQVKRLEEYGAAPLMVVGDRDMLIPFTRSICVEIDPAAKRIVVELPEGLEEL